MDMSAGEIAQLTGGQVHGDGQVRIQGVNGLEEAQPGQLAFARSSRYAPQLAATQASAVLVDQVYPDIAATQIVVAAPDLAFAQVLQCCERDLVRHPVGIHASAVIGDDVSLGEGVAADAHVRVADGTVLGDGVVLYAGVYIGRDCNIGPGTVLYPNVVVREGTQIGARCIIHAGTVIGSDGFGFAPLNDAWFKIPQVGRVVIEDDVEVGSNSAIDRATFGETRIGQGTKIDNLVQVGHNVRIGKHSALAGMTGVAGSAVIGDHVRVGASAGIIGHITVGDRAVVAGRAGVTKPVPEGATVSGFPAMDHNQERRVVAAQRRTPELLRRVRQLERQLEAVEKVVNERQAEDHSE